MPTAVIILQSKNYRRIRRVQNINKFVVYILKVYYQLPLPSLPEILWQVLHLSAVLAAARLNYLICGSNQSRIWVTIGTDMAFPAS